MGRHNSIIFKKKYQNISHLKEIGFIFVVPIELGIIGEMTRDVFP